MKIFIIFTVILFVGTCCIPMAAPADELQGLHGGGGGSSNGTTTDDDVVVVVDGEAKWRRLWKENIYEEEEEEFLMESEVSRRILQQSDGFAPQGTSNHGTYCDALKTCDCINGPKCSKCNPRCISDDK